MLCSPVCSNRCRRQTARRQPTIPSNVSLPTCASPARHCSYQLTCRCAASGSLLCAAIGGYIVIVTNLHPETNDDDVTDAFTDFGHITTLHLNLDRRTGYVKGYALLEYAREDEARRAVEEGDGMVVMERQVTVDWALKKADNAAGGRQRDRRGGAAGDSAGGGGGGSRSRGGVVRRDYRDLGKNIDRGRDRGRDSGRDRDRERDG